MCVGACACTVMTEPAVLWRISNLPSLIVGSHLATGSRTLPCNHTAAADWAPARCDIMIIAPACMWVASQGCSESSLPATCGHRVIDPRSFGQLSLQLVAVTFSFWNLDLPVAARWYVHGLHGHHLKWHLLNFEFEFESGLYTEYKPSRQALNCDCSEHAGQPRL